MYTNEKNIYDDNVIKIVVQETPKTRTLDKVETALSLIDASIKAITDAEISTALDTSSIQTLWSQFEEFDVVTSRALTDLDDRVVTLDASLQSLSVDSIAGLSDDIDTLNTKTDDISTRLSEFVEDCSSASRQDIEDVSTRVKTNSDAIAKNTTDLLDVSTRLYHTVSDVADNATRISDVSANAIVNQTNISDVSNRLAAHLIDHDNTVADVSALKTLTAAHTSRLNGHDASIIELADAIETADASIVSVKSSIAAQSEHLTRLDTSVTDVSNRLTLLIYLMSVHVWQSISLTITVLTVKSKT